MVVEVAPDRRINAVFRPDGPVGEPDLTADGTLPARFSPRADGRGNVVRVLKSKVGIDLGEGVELATGAEDREQVFGDVMKVHGPRRPPVH